MKKLILCALLAVFILNNVSAQDDESSSALSKGSFIIEANTGSWTTGNTAFSLTSIDGDTFWSIGIEGGYFIIDNLAVKAGVGYSDNGTNGLGSTTFTYKVGAKYYVIGKIPVGVDFTGASIKDANENPSYIGVQAGYALFIANNISVEPTLRYNISISDYENAFQGLIGFAFHF